MTLRDLARPKSELVTASPNTSAKDLATLMRDRTVGSVVIAEDDEPVGIVTDRDLAINVVCEGRDAETCMATECMTADPFTVDVNDGVAELCRTMRENGVRRVPVTENGKLAGIVTLDDLLVLLESEMNDISSVIRAESPPFPTP